MPLTTTLRGKAMEARLPPHAQELTQDVQRLLRRLPSQSKANGLSPMRILKLVHGRGHQNETKRTVRTWMLLSLVCRLDTTCEAHTCLACLVGGKMRLNACARIEFAQDGKGIQHEGFCLQDGSYEDTKNPLQSVPQTRARGRQVTNDYVEIRGRECGCELLYVCLVERCVF